MWLYLGCFFKSFDYVDVGIFEQVIRGLFSFISRPLMHILQLDVQRGKVWLFLFVNQWELGVSSLYLQN